MRKGCVPGSVGVGRMCIRLSELEGKPELRGRVSRILNICGSGHGTGFDSRRVSESLCRQFCHLGQRGCRVADGRMHLFSFPTVESTRRIEFCGGSNQGRQRRPSVGRGLRPEEKPDKIPLVSGDGDENGDPIWCRGICEAAT